MSFLTIFSFLAPVVQKMDYIIHRINHYPLDSVMGFPNTYPLDSTIQLLNNWDMFDLFRIGETSC